MADREALLGLREERFFAAWDGFVQPDRVEASEASLRCLIDDLTSLGPAPTEEAARRAVDECTRRFNALDDDGWICTIEREDIFMQICRVMDVCGFACDDDWLSERDW